MNEIKEQENDIEYSGFTGRLSAWLMGSWPRLLFERFIFGDPRQRLDEILNLKGNEIIVDAGCGSGFYSTALAKKLDSGNIIAVDISPDMLTSLRGRAKRMGVAEQIIIEQGDCLALPLNDNLADVGLTVATWHHLPDPAQACRELLRVVKPGGQIVAIDFLSASEHNHKEHDNHHDNFGVEEMSQLLAKAGFVNIQTEIIGQWILGYAQKP